MLKLINAAQTKLADKYTIENEPISSDELMERASTAFVKVFSERYPDKKARITVFCGKGNNGGDGLVIARLLINDKYEKVSIVIADFAEKSSPDFQKNLVLLQNMDTDLFYLSYADDLEFRPSDIIIDALLGSGLTKPLEGEWVRLIKKINQFSGIKVSVDLPTGLLPEGELLSEDILKADLVITFQRPKLNFLLPLSAPYIKEWKVVNIGLDENFIESTSSPYHWFWKKDILKFIKPRQPFDHKGTFGHALIIAGQTETMGAALLSAEACLNTGAGLTTVSIPESGLVSLNSRLPEVMYQSRNNLNELDRFKVIAIGPGLGKADEAVALLKNILNRKPNSLVLDADALNILSENEGLIDLLPENTILTPHLKEFDRLFGQHYTCWQRISTAFKEAVERKIYIILKNRYTMIFSPNGLCYFNSSGSPAMASGGMGDVLTGMITGFIAQGYKTETAILLAVFTHGYAGEQMAQSMQVIPASKLAKQIPYIIKELSIKSI